MANLNSLTYTASHLTFFVASSPKTYSVSSFKYATCCYIPENLYSLIFFDQHLPNLISLHPQLPAPGKRHSYSCFYVFNSFRSTYNHAVFIFPFISLNVLSFRLFMLSQWQDFPLLWVNTIQLYLFITFSLSICSLMYT
jgi:hypothetical protein